MDIYFGASAVQKYGRRVLENLGGRTISTNIFDADAPGGLIYEARQLDIDIEEFVAVLEGLCYNGLAKELDDETFAICKLHLNV